MATGPTRAVLGQRIDELHQTNQRLQREGEMLQRQIDQLHTTTNRQDAQLSVLRGDRARLTATIEILSRRLASPDAENDLARAGQRSIHTTDMAKVAEDRPAYGASR